MNIITTILFISGCIFLTRDFIEAENMDTHYRIIRHDGLEIKLDLSTQILALDILEDRGWGESEGPVEADLYPTLKSMDLPETAFASASIFMAKAKQVDDGLYAAVEYLCQYGTDSWVGKQEILQRTAAALDQMIHDKSIDRGMLLYCQGFLAAAASLGGQDWDLIKDIQKQANNIKSDFLSEPLKSKPLGFYTWNDTLQKIFQQDRLLQQVMDSQLKIKILGRGLSSDSKTFAAYKNYLSLVQKLTNPFPPEYSGLSQISEIQEDRKYCFFPPSASPETELIKRLFGNKSIPDGFNLADELVRKIQNGEIDLTPGQESGWYDHQLYALEPFVTPEQMPEAKNLEFSPSYQKELIDLFKAAIALTRETHVKQLEIPMAGAAMPPPVIFIYPELSLEPTATYYLRRARSYRFIRELLMVTFGQTALNNVQRLTAVGKVSKSLLEELSEIESLFYGTYLIAAAQIGLDIGTQLPERNIQQRAADQKLAANWIRSVKNDPDVGSDIRMMVPVFYDIERKMTRVWVVLGYSQKPLTVSFKKPPTATITDTSGKKAIADLEFVRTSKELIYPVSAEIYVRKLLNRDELRAVCDKYKTRSAILKALTK